MARTSLAVTKSVRPVRRKPAAHPVESLIHLVRGNKVILDADLATLYEVPTKRLNEAVKRNPGRFPSNFLFRLTTKEANALRSQIATSNIAAPLTRGGRRYLPYAFTEHGVVMLSAVLNSDRAIRMSILVVNAFVRIRELYVMSQDLGTRVDKLEHGQRATASVIEALVEDLERVAIDVELTKAIPVPKKRRIGFGD